MKPISDKFAELKCEASRMNPPAECTQIGTVGIDVIDFRGSPLWLKILKQKYRNISR
jgi:hypothetical protein